MTPELRERIERVKHDIAHAFLPRVADVQALIAALKAAAPVAEAVTWCEKNANLVEYRPLKGWLVDDGWHNEMQAGLPAAVAALRQRVEGKRAPEGDAEKGEGSNG